MPYSNLPKEDWPKMDKCVRDVMAKDPSKTEQQAIGICYNSITGKSMTDQELIKAVWDSKYINDLPDAAFAVISAGGKKDAQGKTEPRSLRHLPHHTASVKSATDNDSVDKPHLRNALARLEQTNISAEEKAKAKSHLEAHAKALGVGAKKDLDIEFDFPILVQKKYVEKDQYGNEKWYLEGYAATDDFDLQGDIISPEALKKAEHQLMENSTVLFNHHDDEPIGRVIESHFDQKGLFLKILISQTVPNVWQKVKEGVLNKFSISAKVIKAAKKFIKDLGIVANVIEEIYLFEASLVSVPANPKAKAIRWYVSKALKKYEQEGGEIEVDEKSFEVVEKTDELTLEKSLDPSPNLEAASADDNTESKDEEAVKKSTVVTKSADELGEDATDGTKAPATDKPAEDKPADEKPADEVKTGDATGEQPVEAKADTTEGEAEPAKADDAEPNVEKSKGAKEDATPKKEVTKSDKQPEVAPAKEVKKNMEAVTAMLTDLVAYLDSPDADPAIPAEVGKFCKQALDALTPKSASMQGESETVKTLKAQVATLTEQVGKLLKNQPVTRKGLVRDEEPASSDSKMDAVKKESNPEDRLKKAIQVGII